MNLSLGFPNTGLETVVTQLQAAHREPDSSVRAIHHQPANEGTFSEMPPGLDSRLVTALEKRGITRLYSHQADAFEQIDAGRHVVIVTPTASGKTLCYNLPVLNLLLRDPGARAMYLFPTKALAEDQLQELHTAIEQMGSDLRAFTFDGDTPQDARKAIRQRANIVLTNPDMLHSGILPHHTRWAQFFENLRYIVIDELHYYRGVYGSHLANLLRRLRRICEFYGAKPQFICCSATIANPRELAEALTGDSFELIERNGAPRGEKFFIFYNPPVVNRQLGIRRSYIHETRRMAMKFIEHNLQTLVFANNRLATEVLVTYLKDACDKGPLPSETVRGYRGGYLPRERREIERQIRDGKVRAVVATNALELGIDIGSLDAVVMAGYPGTIASSWQRAGRAGRRQSTSAAVLVASSAPLDQYIVEHPDYFFGRSPEHAHINADNLEILLAHLKCVECDYYTDAIDYTQVKTLQEFETEPLNGAKRAHGDVRVNRQIVGFKKIKFYTMENVGAGKLSMPEQEMHTTSFWLHFPAEFLSRFADFTPTEKQAGITGLGNALRTVAALLLMCDPRDLGVALTEEIAGASSAFEPNLYLYDAYPGGIGQSGPLYRMTAQLLAQTMELLDGCRCDAGCPSCVGPVGEVGERGK